MNEQERTGQWLPLFDGLPAENRRPTEQPLLIGLAGRARSGKSTVAGYLARRYGFIELSFAAPIRTFVADLLDLSVKDLEGPEKEKVVDWVGKSPRYMMQTLGTEWGRRLIGEDFWVKRVLRRVREVTGCGFPVVISDVRFDNEAEAIRAAGGHILHISRPGAPLVCGHVSEAGVTAHLGDYSILNNGSIEALHRQVELAVRYFRTL
ncbi:adenylate kinase [Caldimonas thermodepolymerans]|uniref:Adenylate kinase n=1 Tax=Caldimonas thermodepolymerans TaxID=215580 RepID=A0A2S5T9C9_9BURK|nr:adenylate kinase [Caldimonas thermodepolymerans]PPE71467.1 adenylate kinase [Caldimonas thermodepolymerans]QPC30496.1 adenylate kinase [Caldimonas thermodepolymerans]RDI02919.1 dephospho-CoA kinase [Caldimonas thermodepolymerans]